MIAEIKPQTGGAPEAMAMPSENGRETSETTIPASRSWRQCFKPATPFWGFSSVRTEPTSTERAFRFR